MKGEISSAKTSFGPKYGGGCFFIFVGMWLTLEIYRSLKSGMIGNMKFNLKHFNFIYRKDKPKKFFLILVILIATDLFFTIRGITYLLSYFGFL